MVSKAKLYKPSHGGRSKHAMDSSGNWCRGESNSEAAMRSYRDTMAGWSQRDFDNEYLGRFESEVQQTGGELPARSEAAEEPQRQVEVKISIGRCEMKEVWDAISG